MDAQMTPDLVIHEPAGGVRTTTEEDSMSEEGRLTPLIEQASDSDNSGNDPHRDAAPSIRAPSRQAAEGPARMPFSRSQEELAQLTD